MTYDSGEECVRRPLTPQAQNEAIAASASPR